MIFPTRAGAVWVLSGDRLREQIGRKWVAEATEWRGLLAPAGGRAIGAHEDSDGGVWFNHYGNGVFHIAPDGRFQHCLTTQERVGRQSTSAPGFRHGTATVFGLASTTAVWRDCATARFKSIGLAEGLPARSALSVCQGGDGAMWFGTGGGGLCSWRNGAISSFNAGNDRPADFIFSVFPACGRPDCG